VDTIDHIPTLPTIKRTENPRPWFSPEQYAVLLETCRELRDNPPERTEFDFGELYDFIVFMVHSFLRPSEWKLLQHKHIRVFNDGGIEQLVISVPNSKTKNSKGSIDSTTTEIAADLYAGEVLPHAPVTADAGVHQAVADQKGSGDGVMWVLGYVLDKEIQS
jgi:hypothetical protein